MKVDLVDIDIKEISGTAFGYVREYGTFQPGDAFADRRFRHTFELV